MSLEDLLAPVKWADEQVLRQYTKLTQKWEEKGRSRYSLASLFGYTSMITMTNSIFFSMMKDNSVQNCLSNVSFCLWQNTDTVRNFLEPSFKKDETDGAIAELPGLYLFKKIGDATRLAAFFFGLTLLGKSVVGIIDYAKNKNPEILVNSIESFSVGYTFFGTASSIYIKDSDPKLLDKAPFWKQAYDSVKEIFLPTPQPVPIENYDHIIRERKNI